MQFKIEAPKVYATEENALKAVSRKGFDHLRFFLMKDDNGKFFPVFVGQQAVQSGVHFHFNVVG
jgi:hypothetical protein